MEKSIEKKASMMTANEGIKNLLADAMLKTIVEYFPIVYFIEQVEFEKYCHIMDALTCDNCSQKRKGCCAGRELESMDEIIQKCLIPGVVANNIKGITDRN